MDKIFYPYYSLTHKLELLMTLPQPLEIHESGRLVWDIAEAADDRKAEDIAILKVDQISYLADFFVVVTGFSRTQVRAIADSIEARLETKYNKLPLRMEGKSEGMWILQDYGEVIVHIFLPQEREFYNLEAFWGHAERIEFEPALP